MSETANTSPVLYPKYEYTFKVVSLSPEQGHILVDYLPNDTSLTKITLNIPILANFSPSNLESMIDTFAPHARWFGQKTILNYESVLLGANSNISIE
jgi:hypothetical protein